MRRQAFKLIELMIVTTVIVLLAAIVTPQVVAMKHARDARLSLIQLRDLALQAREMAIRDGHSLVLKYQENQATMQIVRPGDTTSTDETLVNDQVLGTVQLADGVSLRSFRSQSEDKTATDWELYFYADGKADKGGFEVEASGSVQSVRVDATGEVSLVSGSLPQEEDTSWVAGENEKRQ
jgi:type II secretory pathway pseudopilin PulG